MKKLLLSLFFSFCLALTLIAQSVSLTLQSNPIVIDPVSGATFTVDYTYTATTNSQAIYFAFELLDEWTFVETIDETSINPVTMGTDITGSIVFTIPNTVTPTADLTGLQNYKVKAQMDDTSVDPWAYLTGDFPATEIDIQAATASLEDINANGIVMYPNPVSNRLILKSNLLNANTIIISDILGKTVKSIGNSKYIEFIDVSNLQNGLYILTTDNQKQFKFLKN